MNLKLQIKSKTIYAFLMALFSVWGWGQTTEGFESGLSTSGYVVSGGARTLSTGTWTANNSLLRSTTRYAGSYSCQLQKNSSTYLATPSLNSCGVVKFWYYSGVPIVKKTVGGTTTNLTATSGAVSGSWKQYTVNVNDASNGIVISIYNSNDATTYVDEFTWTAYSASTVVPVVTGSSFTGNVGVSFSQSVQATENPTSYAVASGSSLPGGLSLNTTNGLISGTPTTVGSFTTDITATNGAGTSTPATLNFTINKGDQTLTSFTDTGVNLSLTSSVTLPSQTDQGLPVVYNSSNTSIASLSGNILTFSSPGSVLITANQSGNNNYNPLSLAKTFLASSSCFGEDFSTITTGNNTSTSGSSTSWNGNSNFTTLNAAYSAGGAIRLGSGSSTGSITSKVLSNIAGNITVSLAVKGWSSVEGDIIVTLGSQTQTVTYNAILSSGSFENKSLNFSNVPIGSTLTIATTSGRAFIDNVTISCGDTTVWNGTTWSANAPTSTTDVIINGTYSTTSNSSITAKNITIKNGGVLEITSGNTISCVDVTVEDGGNLIQKDGSTLTYSGAFKALKNGTSELNKYAFWSSPVVGQNLTNIYTGTTATSITEYDTAADYYINATSTISLFGKAYSIQTPVANAALVFEGTPNNGTQTFALATSGNGFNLIGNPYPSSLNLGTFYTANSARISSTFYFWDNKSTNVTLQNGASTTNYGYATFNAANGANPTWVPAPNGNGGTAVVPTGSVANIGQGFIVKTLNTSVDTSLTFNNEMRGATNGTFFNKNNSSTEGKFWLKLNSEYNTNNVFAVDYTTGASDSFDSYDSKAIGMGSDGFYTLAGTQKLIIQGKESFDIDDVVPVGTKHFQNGNFTIALVQKEGLFNNGQAIYLHDKVTGTYTDLQNGAYTFTANAGESTSRFEIVYKLNVLATTEVQKDNFEVYRDGQDFVVRNNKNIEKVEIFDAAGRKIQTINESSKLIRVQLASKGVYILKALSEGKEYTKKLIK